MSSTGTDDVQVVEIPILYVRWRVNTWEKSYKFICSSNFKFQGRACYLEHSYAYSIHYVYVRMTITHVDSYAPFDFTLNVESNSTGRIIPELTTKKHVERQEIHECVCAIDEEKIKLLDPAYRRTSCLNLLAVLKVYDDPLTDTDSKAIQTERNTNGASRSTMTSLLPNPTLCLESLSEDLAKLMVQDSDLDVEFQCGDQSTRAHSAIVSVRSPVIASMLASSMTEGITRVINIPSMEPETFQQFLRYLYSGKLDELTVDTAISLYGTGQQYAVHALAKRCSDFLINQLSVENACEILFVADAHSDADFVNAVIDFLVEHKVPTSGGCWPDFCEKHPRLANVVFARYCESLSK